MTARLAAWIGALAMILPIVSPQLGGEKEIALAGPGQTEATCSSQLSESIDRRAPTKWGQPLPGSWPRGHHDQGVLGADLDGDGRDEILAVVKGRWSVINSDGSPHRKMKADGVPVPPGWPASSVRSGLLAANVDQRPGDEILFIARGLIHVLGFRRDALPRTPAPSYWGIPLPPGWPRASGGSGLFAADVDGKGNDEIVFVSQGRFHALRIAAKPTPLAGYWGLPVPKGWPREAPKSGILGVRTEKGPDAVVTVRGGQFQAHVLRPGGSSRPVAGLHGTKVPGGWPASAGGYSLFSANLTPGAAEEIVFVANGGRLHPYAYSGTRATVYRQSAEELAAEIRKRFPIRFNQHVRAKKGRSFWVGAEGQISKNGRVDLIHVVESKEALAGFTGHALIRLKDAEGNIIREFKPASMGTSVDLLGAGRRTASLNYQLRPEEIFFVCSVEIVPMLTPQHPLAGTERLLRRANAFLSEHGTTLALVMAAL